MDFSLTTQNGHIGFSYDETDSIINDVILSLTIKAVSFEKTSAGKHVYPGDWFLNPEFGHNCYEIKNTTDNDINMVIQYSKKALRWLLDSGRAKTINVTAKLNSDNKNRVDVAVDAVQSNGLIVTYSTFYEVI